MVSMLMCLDSSAISSASGGLHLHTILNNNEDSPSRQSMPETPHSARGSLQVGGFLIPCEDRTDQDAAEFTLA